MTYLRFKKIMEENGFQILDELAEERQAVVVFNGKSIRMAFSIHKDEESIKPFIEDAKKFLSFNKEEFNASLSKIHEITKNLPNLNLSEEISKARGE